MRRVGVKIPELGLEKDMYKCDICGHKYDTKDMAYDCELRHKEVYRRLSKNKDL